MYKNDYKKIANDLKELVTKDTIFVFIGTDLVIADSVAPLTCTMLKKKCDKLHFSVIGELTDKVMAKNVNDVMENLLESNENIIGVDACIGKLEDVGKIKVRKNKPIRPGAGVGRQLVKVGKHSITIVTTEDDFSVFSSQIPLAMIYELADKLSDVLVEVNNYLSIRSDDNVQMEDIC